MATLSSILAAKHVSTTSSGGSSSITGGGLGFSFASLTDAIATNLDPGVQWFRTAGLRNAGDMGEGLYYKLTSDPAWATTEPNLGGFISGRNAGVPRTADGAYWKLVPEKGLVSICQFGSVIGKDFNDQSLDQAAWTEDAIWFIINQGYSAALTLFVPSSWFYHTKPVTCHGGHFGIRGSGEARDSSVLWFPHTTHGVIVGYAEAGWITIDAEGGPYNGNFAGLFVGDTRYGVGPDTNHVYICTVAGIPGGWNSTLGQWASPPTGTGSDIVDGTVHWAYQRELTRVEKLALSNGRGGGGNLEHFSPYCGTDWRTPNARSNHSGIVSRNRCTIRDVFGSGWPGCGIVFCSDGDTTFRGGSNSDGWRCDHIVCYWNGIDGLHIGNSKSNAGTLIDGDFAANGRFGVANWCFLDNSFTSMQFAGDGSSLNGADPQYPHGVCYNGRYYIARIPIGGIEGGSGTTVSNSTGIHDFAIYQSPPPDTNSFWIYTGGDGSWSPNGDFPAWVNTGLYEPGGAFAGNNFNDRTVIQKFYQENGTFPAQFMPFNLNLGGLTQWAYGGTIFNDKGWSQPLITKGAAVNTTTGATKNIQFNFGSGSGGGTWNNAYYGTILEVDEYEGTSFLFEKDDTTRFDQTGWAVNSRATNGFTKYPIARFDTLNSAKQWGTGANQTNTFFANTLVVGDRGTDASNPQGRLMWTQWGNVAPSTTNRANGEIAWNGDGHSGDPIGWKYSSTAGAWKSMGTLA